MHFVGVVSDTHGLVRPEMLEALEGSELIIHAGDVGDREVLAALEQIAPVRAVRGNMDRGEFGPQLPLTLVLDVGQLRLHVIHILQDLDFDPATAGFSVVISGHTHEPSISRKRGVLYLNPGSAGPRRFRLPVTSARLAIQGAQPEAEIIELKPS